ncbi:MAG: type II secretion system protein GspM [Pseudomonadota bacterium]|nr:hypothetical protein [Gammaproteobacteria bacterium]MEE2683902.1 type II secretion system protein GspM [Pseudomonadota bacterium]|tara:strand:- start:457 stop:939 length:483 start_codon:yes stop_codon:yes gene_type:complete
MIKYWFLSLNKREKVILIFGLSLSLVIISWFLILKPIKDKITESNISIENNYSTIVLLNKLQDLPIIEINKEPFEQINQSLVLLVDETHRLYNLDGTLIRNQPESDDRIRLTFENAPFNFLISWLFYLNDRYGVIIESITLDNNQQDGLVNSNLLISKPY